MKPVSSMNWFPAIVFLFNFCASEINFCNAEQRANDLSSSSGSSISIKLKNILETKTIMIVFVGPDNLTKYAESLIKEKLVQRGSRMINPEMMEKVKKDQLLWEAIRNRNATAMARISTNYGAEILIRGDLNVESHQRFAQQWGAMATLSISIIDTQTAEEISIPSGEFPVLIEESELRARQAAVKKATESVAMKLGFKILDPPPPDSITFSPRFYRTFFSDQKIKKVKFLPDSKTIAIITQYTAELIQIETNVRAAKYKADDTILSMDISKDGQWIALGLSNNSISFYNRRNGASINYMGERSILTSLAFNNQSSCLAVGFKDGHIELIDVAQSKIIGFLTGHSQKIHSLTFFPDDRILVSVADDLLTTFWDIHVKRETRSFKESADKINSACLSKDGNYMGLSIKEIIVYFDSRNRSTHKRFLVVRDTTTGKEIKRFSLLTEYKDILAIGFHPNKRYLASSSEDQSIRIWDIHDGVEVSKIFSKDPAVSLDFSNDGKLLIFATENKVAIYTL